MIEPAFPFKLLFDDFLQRCCSICMFNALSRFSLDTLEDVLIKTDPVYTHNTYALTVQKKKKEKKKEKKWEQIRIHRTYFFFPLWLTN